MGIAVVCLNTSGAFWPSIHNSLINEAFNAVPEAGLYADRESAKKESDIVDKSATNDDASQHMHSMRSAGVSLVEAQRRTDQYIAEHLKQAIADAKAQRKGGAGRHLGLILHAIQDRKHNWCSCSSSSNGADSNDSCSSSKTGCAVGKGNHGLTRDCLDLAFPGAFFTNTQIKTDRSPTVDQVRDARDQSIKLLKDFVAQM
jgi:hypothetical protein